MAKTKKQMLEESGTKASILANEDAPRLETEGIVLDAIKAGKIAHVVPSDVDSSKNAPIAIEWPEGVPREEVVILIGVPIVGVQQTLRSITTEIDGQLELERVGSYAPGSCGAYMLTEVAE